LVSLGRSFLGTLRACLSERDNAKRRLPGTGRFLGLIGRDGGVARRTSLAAVLFLSRRSVR
jgi:hypothetical protein